jgi:hypothetical protein
MGSLEPYGQRPPKKLPEDIAAESSHRTVAVNRVAPTRMTIRDYWQ